MNVRDLIPWGCEQSPALRSSEVMDPFFSLHREVNRLFNDFSRGFDVPMPSRFGGSGWPHTDVVESDQEYRVTAELPGLEEKDVELTFQDGVLTLKGEKKVEHNGEGARYTERWHGLFQRSISVGSDVDEGRVSASFSNGVLTVVLPKSPEAVSRARRIQINAS
jgi:HSP20 family protein